MNNLLYEILEVSPNASPAVIKTAYRCLAQRWHPDKNPDDPAAAERLKLINQAYGVLADPVLRARYDLKARQTENDRRGSGSRFQPLQSAPETGHKSLRRFAFRPLQ